MAKILIIYSTTDGHTRNICERLQKAVAEHHDVTLAAMAEEPGSIIGQYKLLEKIGEGGMGVVYLAQQEQPVQRVKT